MDINHDLFEELLSDRHLYGRPRIYRERSKDFEKYDDTDFFIRYRLSKESVIFILKNIEHLLEFHDNRRQWIYPLKIHLLSPYLNPVTRGQQKYNDAHIKTRNVVERQYGVLKRRFPVLAVSIRLRLDTAIRVMLACCVLHDICIIRKECEPINDGSIPNLETLINDDQIPRPPITNGDPVYGFQRSQMTQYFDSL
ncbi:hypothetical protein HF086_012795 [Spodoptera exigua]|uniref:DDE Tnp4 domain-containing protein n=1 Tax=Spodoptera exigua TaxID=7107 RepID=A0A922MMN6_SPOEX|nr:hypothetical protein HF086_012795 [Spodoptera exigua]